jgi:hypothetical protein
MTTVEMKSGNTGIEFTSSLETNAAPVDLTGATVVFLLKLSEPPNTAYAMPASVVGTATAGNVKSLSSESGFPTALGKYKQLWYVTLATGKTLSFPSNDDDEYNYIIIKDDLA